MTAYSIGEIEIMVYEEDALGTSHSEVHVISLLNWVENRLLSKLDRYFEEYLPEFYKTYPYHS